MMVMKNPRKIPLGPMELTHIPNLSHGKSTQFFTDVFLFRVGWFGWIYHDLPMIYLWFTYDLSMIYLWFTYMIYLWFIYDLPIWFIYDLSMASQWNYCKWGLSERVTRPQTQAAGGEPQRSSSWGVSATLDSYSWFSSLQVVRLI